MENGIILFDSGFARLCVGFLKLKARGLHINCPGGAILGDLVMKVNRALFSISFLLIFIALYSIGCVGEEGTFDVQNTQARKNPSEPIQEPEPEEADNQDRRLPLDTQPVDILKIVDFKRTVEMRRKEPHEAISFTEQKVGFSKKRWEGGCLNYIQAEVKLKASGEVVRGELIKAISMALYNYENGQKIKMADMYNPWKRQIENEDNYLVFYTGMKKFDCENGEDVATYSKFVVSVSCSPQPGRENPCDNIQGGDYLEVDTPREILDTLR